MPTISLNIPPKTAVMALAFGAIAVYADSKIRDVGSLTEGTLIYDEEHSGEDKTAGIKNVTYKRPVTEHLKNVLVADDFASLRAMYKLRSALDDIMNADFTSTDCDMSPSHLKEVFSPVMPENTRKTFVNVTSNIEKAQRTMRQLSSVKGSSSDPAGALKNMELISQIAEIFPGDALSPLMQMKDVMSSISPLMSMFGSSNGEKINGNDRKNDDISEISDDILSVFDDEEGEGEDGGVYSVSAEDVISDEDDEYDSILEIMRLLKDG